MIVVRLKGGSGKQLFNIRLDTLLPNDTEMN